MSDFGGASKPQPVPVSSSPRLSSSQHSRSFSSRAASIARLAASPVSGQNGSPKTSQTGTPRVDNGGSGSQTPLAGAEGSGSLPGPGRSALAQAFQGSLERSPPTISSSPRQRNASPAFNGSGPVPRTTYGSFGQRSGSGPSKLVSLPLEDHEVVKRHLVHGNGVSPSRSGAHSDNISEVGQGTIGKSKCSSSNLMVSGMDDDEFSSLKLQGGDTTRAIYRWTEEAEANSQGRGRAQRSKSFDIMRPEAEEEVLDINTIKQPGGFRRNYLRRAVESPSPTGRGNIGLPPGGTDAPPPPRPNAHLFTNNFIEFLTLYGHFAGEELEEDDEALFPHEYFPTFEPEEAEDEDREPGEGSALLTPRTPTGRKRKREHESGTNGTWGAVLLLLKSFVGTGVLFLPRAYLNGGMLFSNLVLLAVAVLSFYCFILLIRTRMVVEGSFGDIGGALYGKWMRALILGSIVLSQIGFASAYIVFTSENLQAFILAVSKCKTYIDIKFMILMQLVVFLPLSLVRDISKLGFTALIADVFILLGLLYLYYYDIFTLVSNHGMSDVTNFNPDSWTLFIGTAIFTFEGIGLIIPIQESMKKPHTFPSVLGGVMVVITIVFLSMGALSYAAFGSKTETVVILNLPQDDKMVNGVQFIYSLAILLSTPLQLFPAIRITENELFTRSGKYNPYIKWKKNIFRFFIVMGCALLAWLGAGDLDKFVSLVGSFACVPLVNVYPPLLHLKAVSRKRWQKIADISLCCFGFIMMAYTTVLTAKSWVSNPPSKGPGYCDEKSGHLVW